MNLRKYKGATLGFFVGLIYALICSGFIAIGEAYSIEALEFVSLTMIIIMPIIVGVFTILFSTPDQARSKNHRRYGPWLSILGWTILSLMFAMETIICIIMLLPLYLPLATLGGILGGQIRKKYCERINSGIVSCFALLPFLMLNIEATFQSPTIRVSVVDSIVINASLEKVWETIPNLKNINKNELKWTLSHYIGLPRPVSATTASLEVGSIRDLNWEKGVHFQEKITKIIPEKLFAYDVLIDQESMKIAELDTHIVVGDKYFDVESGYYSLKSKDAQTILSLTSTYRMSTKMNWYGKFLANFVFDDFHSAVLSVIKQRAEKV
jgi:hypothetical protein